MTDGQLQLNTVSNSLVGLLIMIAIDVCCNSFVLFCDMESSLPKPPGVNNVDPNLMFILAIVLIALQLILNLILIFWYFFLVWKTFPFRFGLLKKLLTKEVPVLLVVPLNFLLFISERFYRLYCLYIITDLAQRNNVVTLYSNPIYMTLFWVRNIFAVFMYAFTI